MKSVLDLDRNKKISIDRLNGMTLQAIGDKYGFTRERARQIYGRIITRLVVERKDMELDWMLDPIGFKDKIIPMINQLEGNFVRPKSRERVRIRI